MNRPLVSVIIPAYNEASHIGPAIESVAQQTYDNIEIIVVNDGSTDDTGSVVHENYPQIVYVEQENAGAAAARNTGALVASGELLTFLDADDRLVSDKIAKQLAVLQEHPEWELIGTNGLIYNGRHVYPWNNPDRPRLIEYDLHDLIWGYEPIPPSIMLATELLREVGGYDTSFRNLHEDEDLLYRLAGAGHKVAELNEPLYIITRKPNSLVSTSPSESARWYLKALENCRRLVHDEEGAPLTPQQYSFAMGDRACAAISACFRAGKHQLALEYLACIDELAEPAPIHRLLRRMGRLSWPLFGTMANLYHGSRRVVRGCQAWGGVTGALRQIWRRYLASSPGSLSSPGMISRSRPS